LKLIPTFKNHHFGPYCALARSVDTQSIIGKLFRASSQMSFPPIPDVFSPDSLEKLYYK